MVFSGGAAELYQKFKDDFGLAFSGVAAGLYQKYRWFWVGIFWRAGGLYIRNLK